MHNESNATRKTEPSKPSRMSRIKDAALPTAAFAVTVGIVGVSTYYGLRTQKMQFEIAKLALAAAKTAAE